MLGVAGASDRTGGRPIRAVGSPKIVVVGSTGDPITPYRWAQALASQLANGVLLTRVGDGHTAYGASSCIRSDVDRYLIDRTAPCIGDLLPEQLTLVVLIRVNAALAAPGADRHDRGGCLRAVVGRPGWARLGAMLASDAATSALIEALQGVLGVDRCGLSRPN